MRAKEQLEIIHTFRFDGLSKREAHTAGTELILTHTSTCKENKPFWFVKSTELKNPQRNNCQLTNGTSIMKKGGHKKFFKFYLTIVRVINNFSFLRVVRYHVPYQK